MSLFADRLSTPKTPTKPREELVPRDNKPSPGGGPAPGRMLPATPRVVPRDAKPTPPSAANHKPVNKVSKTMVQTTVQVQRHSGTKVHKAKRNTHNNNNSELTGNADMQQAHVDTQDTFLLSHRTQKQVKTHTCRHSQEFSRIHRHSHA